MSGSYTLSWTYSDHESNRFDGVTNPFNLADEWSFSASDQRHRFVTNASTMFPWGFQVSTIFFVGSTRPINTRTTLDPFGSGTGRWLDATRPRRIPAAPCRATANAPQKNDYKLDLRVTKTFNVTNRVRLQGIVEAFNILNTENLTNYNGIVTATTYPAAGELDRRVLSTASAAVCGAVAGTSPSTRCGLAVGQTTSRSGLRPASSFARALSALDDKFFFSR